MTDAVWPLAPLPWQQPAWAQLGQSIEGQRFPHALLITGSAGIGKVHFCRALVALLLCHQPVAGTACGACRACGFLQAGSHTDFLDLMLEEGSRMIKVDQIRRLGQFVTKTASLGDNKLVLLNDAETMNQNAANALLKSLEEPAQNTYLILVSANASRITPTVRSRCQHLSLSDPADEISLAWVEQLCGDKQLSKQLLEHASGKPLLAKQLFESDQLSQRQALRKGLAGLMAGDISPLDFPALVTDEDLDTILGILSAEVERAIRVRVDAGDRQLRQQFQALDSLQLLRRRVSAGGNPNRQLSIESAAMQVVQVLGVAD
jgi:DNA polymerase-3 subunit delta'